MKKHCLHFLRWMPVHIIINFLSSNIYSDDKILRWIQSSSNLPISCFELIFRFIGSCFFFILSMIKERIATIIPSANTTKAVKILSKAISLKSFSLHAFSEGLKRSTFKKIFVLAVGCDQTQGKILVLEPNPFVETFFIVKLFY